MTNAKFLKAYGPWGLVTGASDGIGRAIASDAAARGLNLILTARRGDRLQTLADQIQSEHGTETLVVTADLTRADGLEALVSAATSKDIGFFAACGGFGTSGRFGDIPLADELAMIDVNCRSVVELSHAIVRRMRQRRRGGIVMMSSIVAFQGAARAANYAATKAFIQTFAEGLRLELASSGVDVLAAAPGPVASGFAERARMQMGAADKPERVARDTLNALGRAGTARPGRLSKILGYNLALAPRSLRLRIMSGIMDGMTRESHDGKAAANDWSEGGRAS